MSDLTVTPTEAPSYDTGFVQAEVLGVRKRKARWKDEHGEPQHGTFLSVQIGTEDPKRTDSVDYPWTDEPTMNSALGRMLDRFGFFETGDEVDLEDLLVGQTVEVHVTSAEDRDEDFHEFDRDTLQPLE